jgi:hypothetical protein
LNKIRSKLLEHKKAVLRENYFGRSGGGGLFFILSLFCLGGGNPCVREGRHEYRE